MSYMLKPCQEVKKRLKPGVPFGVDLLIPKIGDGARATNKDRLSATFNDKQLTNLAPCPLKGLHQWKFTSNGRHHD